MHKRVLMIAFHYPPALASGTHRTLSFSRDLPEFGWEPIVLTAHPRVHERLDPAQEEEIPPDIRVHRVFALDAKRHLAIRGRYLRLTAWPDRWSSWYPAAVLRGLQLILQYRPQVIWSTYPIPTTLLIARTLHRLTGLPWVADLRDPLVTGQYPSDPALKKSFTNLERKTLQRCTRITVSTPGLQRFLTARHPEIDPDKWALIFNGYDERSFKRCDHLARPLLPNPAPLTLVHGGTLYTGSDERNPGPFFNVLAQLRQQRLIGAPQENSPTCIGLNIVLRATAHDEIIQAMLRKRHLTDLVTIAPPLPYHAVIQEMFQADGLLMFQGEGFDHLIPAKLFEYLRTRRPILALTGEHGDSARILRDAGLSSSITSLHDEALMAPALLAFLNDLRTGKAKLPDPQRVAGYSRRLQAKNLADLFDQLVPAAHRER
ncbi:MAG: glycosyltransferase [Magnetococcus sp. YQC-9]